MPVDPRLQSMLEAGSPPPLPAPPDVAQARAEADAMAEQMMVLFAEPGPEMTEVVDETVPVRDGEITVRIYRPSEAPSLPACTSTGEDSGKGHSISWMRSVARSRAAGDASLCPLPTAWHPNTHFPPPTF